MILILLLLSILLFLFWLNKLYFYPKANYNKVKSKFIFSNHKHPLNIAHRGGGLESPENTLIAFDHALNKGSADMFELDVQMSKDHDPVVIHNETLMETTNGNGFIRDYSTKELKKLNAAYNFTNDDGTTYPYREKLTDIPTLEEVFVKYPNTYTLIDIKKPFKPLVNNVFSLINRYSRQDKTIIATISWRVWSLVLKKATDYNQSEFIFCFPPQETLRLWIYHKLYLTPFFKTNYHVISIPMKIKGINLFNDRLLKELREMNIPVFYWTINNKNDMKQLIEAGVEGIITDLPTELDKLRQSK